MLREDQLARDLHIQIRGVSMDFLSFKTPDRILTLFTNTGSFKDSCYQLPPKLSSSLYP
jgi:hypothetical protein